MIFRGRFVEPSFAAFAGERASRLGLGLQLMRVTTSECTMVVSGQRGFADAFEMALSLGPIDCQVDSVETQDDMIAEVGA